MKKLFILSIVILAATSVANAQLTKIGGGLGFTTGYYFHGMKFDYNKSGNFNIYAKAIYELKLPVHISPSVTFFLPHVWKLGDVVSSEKVTVTTLMVDINAHYVFNSLDRFEFYALAGPDIILAWKKDVQKYSASPSQTFKESDNALGLNVGAGTYIKIAQQMDLNIEAKYLVGHYHQFMLNAGILVNFQYIIKHSKEPI